MSRLNDLIRQVAQRDETLAADLQREFAALADRRSFGLNFERHVPEAVELPGRPVRRGDKVRVLPPRGEPRRKDDRKLWRVTSVDRRRESPEASLVALADDSETTTAAVADLVVVAEFRDPIYPGLVSTGKVERGGDKPFHTVINAENYHALQALLFTHRGKVDCIYIDPPYNTGAKDWKYNNDYVEGDDLYRHSKWLALMERRLLLAKELLNPDDSVLIVTIDEKEYLRLGLLLEQVFPAASIQMVSATVNPKGTSRPRMFSRVDEYIFFVLHGDAHVPDMPDNATSGKPVRWRYLRREDDKSVRGRRPRQFYPVFIDPGVPRVVGVGEPIPIGIPRESVVAPPGLVAVFGVRETDGREMEWGVTGPTLMRAAEEGFVRATVGNEKQPYIISYLTAPNIRKILTGELIVTGLRSDGSKIVVSPEGKASRPKTVLRETRHSAGDFGTKMLGAILADRKFPFPKSLYAVEDALRYFIVNRPGAVVLDFFAGSGTTAHAVMRLNRQDEGRRRSILVSNNEVSAEEQESLREQGLRPGDPEWEQLGICDFITKPRIEAAITGVTPNGEPIKGDYKFTDEFPMADGFEENVEFFTLTYEAPLRVASHRAFERMAPLLWLRAGSRGRRIDDVSAGWDVAEAYGVLANLDHLEEFLKAVAAQDDLSIAFIVTDEDRLFETVARELPDHVEPVRLYDAYLRNFEIEAARGSR